MIIIIYFGVSVTVEFHFIPHVILYFIIYFDNIIDFIS